MAAARAKTRAKNKKIKMPDISFDGLCSPCCQEQSHLREVTAGGEGAVTDGLSSVNAMNRTILSNSSIAQ
jgi:hypothetical protein